LAACTRLPSGPLPQGRGLSIRSDSNPAILGGSLGTVLFLPWCRHRGGQTHTEVWGEIRTKIRDSVPEYRKTLREKVVTWPGFVGRWREGESGDRPGSAHSVTLET
jgi:hypothetical protein